MAAPSSESAVARRVLFLATTTGYQTRMFGEAAARLGVQLVFATDRCDHLDDPWADSAIPVRFHDEARSLDAIARALADSPPNGVLAVGDRATILGAHCAARFRLPGNTPAAAETARDKTRMRERLAAAGLPVPSFIMLAAGGAAQEAVQHLTFPVVLKPRTLSGSRGVIRADSAAQFVAAFARIQRLLDAPDVRAMRDAATRDVQVESFIEGREYAVEGVLHQGRLHLLAIFDKPDPLDGPFFEETIYVTPSRTDPGVQRDIARAVQSAVEAVGLYHGPLHAECRVNARGVFVLEVAPRPIGGLCARALSFESAAGLRIGLEELLLRHAIGESPLEWRRETAASGVMMIPIPRAGFYRHVDGTEDARSVPHVTDVQITAKPGHKLVPLPEGASYLGFIFARGDEPALVEQALREAHARLTVHVDRDLPIAAG